MRKRTSLNPSPSPLASCLRLGLSMVTDVASAPPRGVTPSFQLSERARIG